MRWGLFGGIGIALTATVAALILSPLRSQSGPPTPVAYQPHRGATIAIGMNLASPEYWGTQATFIDRFKTSGRWAVPGQKGVEVPLDADGYPLSAPTTSQFALDPSGAPVDTYVLTYRGEGVVKLVRATTINAEPGRITFAKIPDKTNVTISIVSMNPGKPIHDIHVVRSDQLDRFAKGEIFNPDYVAMVSHFAVLRFMDWGHTNQPGPLDWTARSTLQRASWSLPLDGVPIEVMVRLANEAHTDMWYNVRMQSDDVFVRNATTYIRDNLAPGLRLHLEYGNEVWNWGFNASHYADEHAKLMMGPMGCGTGPCNPTNKPTYMTYYGYRAAQIQAIARRVFGAQANKRLVGVMGAFQRGLALSSATLDGVRLAKVGAVPELFGEYAITTYFGIPFDKKNPATVLGWARSGPSGLDAAFHEMEYGGALANDQSIAKMADAAAKHAKIAKANGMRLVAYEGGVSLVPKQAAPEDFADLSNFFQRLVDDPRMGDIYDAMESAFAASGGSLAVNFKDIGVGDKYGYWTMIPGLYETSTPRYRFLVKAADRARAAGRR